MLWTLAAQAMHREQRRPCSALPFGHPQRIQPRKPSSVLGTRGRQEDTARCASLVLAKAGMCLGILVMWHLGQHRIICTDLVAVGLRWVALGFFFVICLLFWGSPVKFNKMIHSHLVSVIIISILQSSLRDLYYYLFPLAFGKFSAFCLW